MDKKPVEVMLFEARERANPMPYQISSNNLVDLAIEAAQLAKLVATEQRDLAVIQADHAERTQFLETSHEQILSYLEKTFNDRSQYIENVHESAKMLIRAGEFKVAQEIIFRLGDFLTDNSPIEGMLKLRRGQ